MQRLRVGYVGVALASYFAEEHNQYGRAIQGLEQLSQELDFDLVAIPYGLTDIPMAEQAARELREHEVDFLLIQNAACSLGEQILHLSKAAPRARSMGNPGPTAGGRHPAPFVCLHEPLRLDPQALSAASGNAL